MKKFLKKSGKAAINPSATFSAVAGYNLAAPFYDAREKYLNSFEQGKLLPLLGGVNGKRVLDIGAGTGRISLPLARLGARVTAADISEEMLKILVKKCQAANRFVATEVTDAETLPFESEVFDIVVATFLLVHLKNPAGFFDEVYRVLKPEGILVVTNINQKEPPPLKSRHGSIVIKSYYHRPEAVRKALLALAFTIAEEVFIHERDTWVNQILVARK
ncbi:MAG: class I SAM-dependent methyltransferase [Candidatus Magasanikbacteria bacterium]|nr:class I SAM-dependent methyltransferase [Candidatus Magasanikbacteria bacterium]